MVFSSLLFIYLFFALTMFVYCYVGTISRKNLVLLVSSLIFYAWGGPKYLILLLAMTLISWFFALQIHYFRGNLFLKRLFLILGVGMQLALLGYFKYAGFILENIQRITGVPEVVPEIILPIGISFYTFQLISYVVDVYRGEVKPQKRYWLVLLYCSLFHQCIAGPIVRYKDVAREIEHRRPKIPEIGRGINRFTIGLVKKAVFANSCAQIADAMLPEAVMQFNSVPALGLWLGALMYMLQIYLDFSAYSDMAIGMGLMVGFHYKENFNYPYISKSVSEFWRRWHISLGQFFRDYVYVPMGGSRVTSKFILVRTLFVVWLLTGIWHGASWNFIMWGLGYFLLLTIEKLIMLPRNDWGIISKSLYRCFTLLAVLLGWVLFRADGMHSAFYYVKSMFGLSGNAFFNGNTVRYITNSAVLLVLAVLFSTPVISNTLNYLEKKYRIRILIDLCYIVLFLLAVSSLVMGANNPFIYFNF